MSKKLSVFGFMINPHEMQIVSEDGLKSLILDVESEELAKEQFMSEGLNQQLISILGRTDFNTIWVDDPAGNQKVIEACKKAEEQEERPEPQFDTNGKTKIIDVECSETQSEREIKILGRQIRDLKAEALQTASQYREEIKVLKKRFFQMCDGKSYTQMECTVETDWETGERKYIRPDTGEIACVEKIPYEEQQLNMNKDLEADTSEEKTPDEAVVEKEDGESSGETEQVTEGTELCK